TDKYLHGVPNDSRVRTDGHFLKESSITKERLQQVEELNKLAVSRGQSLAQMALSWVLRDKAVASVLTGASKASQVRENINAAKNTSFTQG
ncbi:MAG: aldo/keto reductase, partial [Hydrogenoanaerobacterium sp.]